MREGGRVKRPDVNNVASGDREAPDVSGRKKAAPQSRDPRAAKWQAIVQAATKYNAAHADLVAEFNKLTGGKCAGSNAGVSVREVRKWQSEHGLSVDGKIGPKSIEAAKKASKATKPDGQGEGDSDGRVGGAEKINFADNAAGYPEGPEGAADGGGLADSIVEGGEVGGEEKREEGTEDPVERGRWLGAGGRRQARQRHRGRGRQCRRRCSGASRARPAHRQPFARAQIRRGGQVRRRFRWR